MTTFRCHRCGVQMTLTVVGDDHCRQCKAEIKAREEADAKRAVRFQRFSVSKDFTGHAA